MTITTGSWVWVSFPPVRAQAEPTTRTNNAINIRGIKTLLFIRTLLIKINRIPEIGICIQLL
jgi:hypothetical protein